MNLITKSFELPYDKDMIYLDIPERNVLYYGSVNKGRIKTDNQISLRKSLNAKPLKNFVEGRRVCLIVEDVTREVPLEDLLNITADSLQYAAEISVLIATGTHEGENEGNYKISEAIKKASVQYKWHLKKVSIHNCHSDKFLYAGQTKSIKNKVYVNAEIENTEVFVTFSDMKNHYFAGYSNAVKNFLPGICAYDTVEKNHSLALKDTATFGYHPLHPDENRRENPLALDMWEGYQLIVGNRPVYVVATITQKNQILWSGAGLLSDVLPDGIRMVDQLMSLRIKKADYLIVSCGGYPNDESLYSAQRALELTKNAVKQGGEILFLAACSNGIGPKKSVENFYRPLKQDIQIILQSNRDNYEMYSHKKYKFAQLIKRMKRIHVKTLLKDRQISDIHLHPVDDAQAVVNSWISNGEHCSINILTQGNKVAVYS